MSVGNISAPSAPPWWLVSISTIACNTAQDAIGKTSLYKTPQTIIQVPRSHSSRSLTTGSVSGFAVTGGTLKESLGELRVSATSHKKGRLGP